MFCSNCGKELRQGSRFCGYCGSKAGTPLPEAGQSAQNPPPMQPEYRQPVVTAVPPPAPEVVWVFSTSRKLSLLKIVPCNVVFLRDRLVLAHLTPELQKAENARLTQDIKNSGTGFFKGSAAMMSYWAQYNKKYYSMSVNDILAEDPSNAVVYYSTLTEIYFKCYSSTTNFDDNTESANNGKLHISLSNGDTIKLTHTERNDNTIREILGSLFGGLLKYKK